MCRHCEKEGTSPEVQQAVHRFMEVMARGMTEYLKQEKQIDMTVTADQLEVDVKPTAETMGTISLLERKHNDAQTS